MAEFPSFEFTSQEDWYGELAFFDAGTMEPFSLPGDTYEMLITPQISTADSPGPVKTLTMMQGGGLSFMPAEGGGEDRSVLVFRVARDTARGFERKAYTADVLQVVSGERHLFMPVRVTYGEPAALRAYVPRTVGVAVTFSARRQPILVPVAATGRQGKPGATIIYRTAAPAAADGRDDDFCFVDLSASGLGRFMYGPKAKGAWPPTPWPVQVPGSRKEIRNQGYVALASDTEIAIMAIDQTRAIYLPDADRYPVAQDLVIMDLTGEVSEAKQVFVLPKTPDAGDTKDKIVGADGDQLIITQPYFVMRFRRGGPNQWMWQR